ncbi:membrane-anchored junction protein [Ctenodactylus gundi]
MTLKPFTYPFPETRFLHAGSSVYKFKIRYGNSIRGEEIGKKEVIIQELEDSIRAVLGNLDNLEPFVTEHFIVFPYKNKWERVSHLKFKHEAIILTPYPFVVTLYVEMKWLHENLSPDSEWRHKLPETVILPLEQNSPPPPEVLGTRGFFGFLSALFPFRYFFRKSSQ